MNWYLKLSVLTLKMFFFGLFFVTIITIFNILLSVYFIIKAKDKTGPRGRKGLKGTIGEPEDELIFKTFSFDTYKSP